MTLPLAFLDAQPIPVTTFEKSNGITSSPYEATLAFFEALELKYPKLTGLHTYEKTDIGKPLHVFVMGAKGPDMESRPTLLINNGIHPGESCGVDASMMLCRALLADPDWRKALEKITIAVIPHYNVGGTLHRGCCTRANQVGPTAQGFRGNAQNRDLNRDFIKTDTRNTEAFAKIFHSLNPVLFIDTHTTNGADYPAPMTLIATLPQNLPNEMAQYQEEQLVPTLYRKMEARNTLMCPYVYNWKSTPEQGLMRFADYPRYSTGYAAHFRTFALVTEAHMLKSFAERVEATQEFLWASIEYLKEKGGEMQAVIEQANASFAQQDSMVIQWQLDTTQKDQLLFDGYAASQKPGAATGFPVVSYDQAKPYQKQIPYLQTYRPVTKVRKPKAYVLPQAYSRVADILELNRVELVPLKNDTTLTVRATYLEQVKSYSAPYEGHFYHNRLTGRYEVQEIQFYEGDYLIPLDQQSNRVLAYLIHVLEPKSDDSFFRWNFFDGILMQKEYFSAYLFEELAAQLLEKDPELKRDFEQKKETDAAFAGNQYQQLNFIYKRSPYYEKSHLRYPVFRIE